MPAPELGGPRLPTRGLTSSSTSPSPRAEATAKGQRARLFGVQIHVVDLCCCAVLLLVDAAAAAVLGPPFARPIYSSRTWSERSMPAGVVPSDVFGGRDMQRKTLAWPLCVSTVDTAQSLLEAPLACRQDV